MNSQKIIAFTLFFALGFNPFVLAQGNDKVSSEGKEVQGLAPEGNIPADASSDAEKESISPTVSKIDVLDFKATDIREALEVIEAKAGLVIVLGPEVWGKITIYLQNIDVWDALQIILEANRLAYDRENGIVNIMSAKEFESKNGYEFGRGRESRIVPIVHIDPEEMVANLIPLRSKEGKIMVDRKSNTLILLDETPYLSKMEELIDETDVPMGTGVFRLRYAQIKDVKQRVENLLTQNIGRLEMDEKANKITVTDKASKIKEIAKLIEEIDKKVDVLIEARVFQIRLIEEHKDGIDWEAIVSDYQPVDLTADDQKNILPGSMQLSLGAVTEEDYEVLLEALETVGELVELSSSKITAVVNRETKLNVDSNKAEEEKVDTVAREQNSFEMQMKIKPKLEDGTIALTIIPKLRWMFIERRGAGHWKMATYLAKEGSTIKLKSDEIVVMGGMMGEREVAKMSKFPLLGDIPILGFAFRRRNKLIEKMEYVIFLTQKIIKGEAEAE